MMSSSGAFQHRKAMNKDGTVEYCAMGQLRLSVGREPDAFEMPTATWVKPRR
jgi:hypothetical protein